MSDGKLEVAKGKSEGKSERELMLEQLKSYEQQLKHAHQTIQALAPFKIHYDLQLQMRHGVKATPVGDAAK